MAARALPPGKCQEASPRRGFDGAVRVALSASERPWVDHWPASHSLKSLNFLVQCFVETDATKQFSWATKPFSAFGADIRKQPLVINPGNDTADSAGSRTRRDQMRTVSFILAFAFVLAGPSVAGSSDHGLAGIGTFSYNGSPIATPASRALVVAAR